MLFWLKVLSEADEPIVLEDEGAESEDVRSPDHGVLALDEVIESGSE